MATRKISYREAINEALSQEMERDPSVIVMGEDVAGGAGGQGEDDAWGGVLGSDEACAAIPGRVWDSTDHRIRVHRRRRGRRLPAGCVPWRS
jgi:pyruvate dehydrogenase E1 component beta subunit